MKAAARSSLELIVMSASHSTNVSALGRSQRLNYPDESVLIA